MSQIDANTQVSLNSDASIIAIGYVDHRNNEVVDIADFNELPRLKSTRLALGQYQGYTISFGIDPKTLLVTTRSKSGSALLRVDIARKNNPIIRKLYEHTSTLRFPVEAETNKFVFLEQLDESTGRSRWQILDAQRKYSSSAGSFRMAAPPSVVDGAVFLPIPSPGFKIAEIVGKTPMQVADFFKGPGGFMTCVGKPDSITCIRNDLTVLTTEVYGELIIKRGDSICRVPSQWADLRSLTISSNGRYAVFHARPRGENQRSFYSIFLGASDCTPKIFEVAKEK